MGKRILNKNLITMAIIAILIVGAVIVFTQFSQDKADSPTGSGGLVTDFSQPGQVAGVATQGSAFLSPSVFRVPEYFKELPAVIAEPIDGEFASYELNKKQLEIKLSTPLSPPYDRGEIEGGKVESLVISYVNSAPETPVVNNNKVEYAEAYLGVDFDFRLYDGLVRQLITLNHVNAAQEFTISLDASSGLQIGEMTGGYLPIYKVQTPFREGTSAKAGEKEEVFILKVPQGIGVNGARIDYEYKKVDDKTYQLTPKRSGQLARSMYPIKIDASIQVVSWDEALVKVGENGREAGNAKDGDVVTVKPAGWNWGIEERKRFVVVRVPKYSDSQRRSYTEFNEQGSYTFGLDYTQLATQQQLGQIRNYLLPSPVLDATLQPEVIKKKSNVLGSIIPDNHRLAYVVPKQGFEKCNDIVIATPSIVEGEAIQKHPGLPRSLHPPLAGLRSLAMTQIDTIGCYTEVLAQKIFKPAQAVTINISSIGTASRDYSTMQTWEDAVDGDLVAAQVLQKGEAYADSDYTAKLAFQGSTTDSTYYLWITAPLDERHDGTAGTGVVIKITGFGDVIQVVDDRILVEWIEIDGPTAATKTVNGVFMNGNSIIVRNMIIHDLNVSNGGWELYGIYDSNLSQSYRHQVYNNIIYNIDYSVTNGDAIGILSIDAYNNTIYNVTSFDNTGYGISYEDPGAGFKIYNNIAVGSDVDFIKVVSIGDGASKLNNISTDTTAPGNGSHKNQVAADLFQNIGNNNFHLRQGAVAVDNGSDLSSTFSIDIDGQIRRGNWDIGADEMPCADNWWHCNWNKRRKITLDNSAQSGSLTDFPASVQLNATRIDFNNATTSDIRFVDADNSTLLQHEIENWDETGTSTLWVKVPSIDTTGTDYIWMYYSNGYVTSTATTTGVWDDNFAGVWHLDESPANDVAGHDNSAGTSNTGTPKNFAGSAGSTTNAAGKMDGADEFDGSNDYVDTGSHIDVDTGPYTISAWYKGTEATTWATFVGAAINANNGYLIAVNANKAALWSGSNSYIVVGTSVINDDAWHHIVGARDASDNLHIYVDGISENSAGPYAKDLTVAKNTLVGAYSDSDLAWAAGGLIDEARISKIARSLDWIKFSYCNMNDTCNSYGAEQQQQVAVGVKYR